MSACQGLRVLRGPDWAGQDADGGEGFLGTVTQSLDNQTVRVQWDMGEESTCCAGKDGKFELRIFDNAQAGVRHPGTACAECGEQEVSGMLWRCQECTGYDLCTLCYSDDKHNLRHRFLRIDAPCQEGQLVQKRKTSVKVRAIGIFPGSTVVRGKDWEWGDQDGGGGSQGVVKGFDTTPSITRRAKVSVQWPQGAANSYRLGFCGNVDLKCVEEDVGPFYYRDHLPLLDTSKVPMTVVSKPATSPSLQQPCSNNMAILTGISPSGGGVTKSGAGAARAEEEQSSAVAGAGDTEAEKLSVTVKDKVVIRVGEDRLKEMQKSWGGCTARMLRCIGRTGDVTGTTTKGEICVRFGATKFNYRFNPQVLLKVPKFSVNDKVRIRGDLELVKVLNTRVGWKSSMDKTAGRVGKVIRVDDDGDLRVDFNGRQYAYTPACCLPVDADVSVDTLDTSSSSGRLAGEDSGKTNSTDQSEQSANMALFRKVRDALRVQSGQSQNQGGSYSIRALFAAIEMGQVDQVRDICQQDPDLIEKQHQGITPLIYASLRGKLSCVVTLMDLGADPNTYGEDEHKTPMSAVIEGKSEDVAEVLLARGASTTQLYGDGHTLTHLSVIRNKCVILQALAKHGADLNAQDDHGNTPIHIAIQVRRHQAMEVLVDLPQVDIHLTNKEGLNLMQLCAYVDYTRALQRLIARDCSKIEALRQGHSSALHIAATNDHVECVRLLVMEGGAKVNGLQAHTNQTALHIASHRAKVSTVEALLELGADVNVHDRDGDTPLHLAIGGKVEGYKKTDAAKVVVACRIQIANMLISSGAFVDAANRKGRHPFLYGVSDVRNGVITFMKHNRGVVRRESRRDADHFLSSMGASSVLSSRSDESLRDALRGVDLPCGLCGNSQSDVTLQPCQHKCVCSACSAKAAKCPLCDEEVLERVHAT